jgi:hypothetical protein
MKQSLFFLPLLKEAQFFALKTWICIFSLGLQIAKYGESPTVIDGFNATNLFSQLSEKKPTIIKDHKYPNQMLNNVKNGERKPFMAILKNSKHILIEKRKTIQRFPHEIITLCPY